MQKEWTQKQPVYLASSNDRENVIYLIIHSN